MEKDEKSKPIKPKSFHVRIVENGKITTDVSIPFFMIKMGMKFAQRAAHGEELARLEEIDMDTILEAINSGELSLPCTLVDVDEGEKNRHVTITLL